MSFRWHIGHSPWKFAIFLLRLGGWNSGYCNNWRLFFVYAERHGFHILPVHCHRPVPDTTKLPDDHPQTRKRSIPSTSFAKLCGSANSTRLNAGASLTRLGRRWLRIILTVELFNCLSSSRSLRRTVTPASVVYEQFRYLKVSIEFNKIIL